MNKIKLILILTLLSFFSQCKEQKPIIDPNITFVSRQIPGILPYFKGALLDPYWTKDGDRPPDLIRMPNIEFVSNQNLPFRIQDYPNHYKILVFFYAKCNGICPMITSNLIRFLPQLKNQSNVMIVSLTINPEDDTVDELQKYKTRYKIKQNNWFFLTGEKEKIHNLAREQFSADVKFIQGQYDLKDFVHTENVFLLDKENYLRGVYRAKGTGDLERLINEYEVLAGH